MECFDLFNEDAYSTDNGKKILTKKNSTPTYYPVAYGKIPLRCDGSRRGIHTFEIVVEKGVANWMIIGIDEGRTNMNANYYLDASRKTTNHYGLSSGGYIYTKGLCHFIHCTESTVYDYHSINVHHQDKYTKCGVEYRNGGILKMRVDEGQNTISFAAGNGDFKQVAKIQKSNTPYYLFVQCGVGSGVGKVATLQNHSCSGGGGDDAKETENEQQIESLMEEKEIANAKIASLEEMVRNLRAEKQKSQQRVEELGAEKEAATNEHRHDNDELRREIARLNEELEVFKGKYFDSEQKKNELSDQIETMQEQMAVLMEEKQEMNVRNQSLMQQVSEMQEEEKQREEEVQRLKEEVKRLKLQCIDETQYEQWSHEEIAAWILNLDNGRLSGYEKILRKSLKEEDVDGELLRDVDGSDLKRWGITKMRDFKFLQREIAKLVTGKAEQGPSNIAMMDANALANEGANAAPTAFV